MKNIPVLNDQKLYGAENGRIVWHSPIRSNAVPEEKDGSSGKASVPEQETTWDNPYRTGHAQLRTHG